MKLLDVQVVLDADKGIRRAEYETEVFRELDDKTTSYAIVSHRWGTEVSYKEMVRLMKRAKKEREQVRQRDGYKKIVKSCKQAMKDGYRWLWIDTCCIDKRSSAELSEAINSMYRWYRNSQKCYVYLNDVNESAFPTEQDYSRFERSNGWPEWFSRGWTLQELIAPTELEFFNTNWVSIGTKEDLTSTLEEITRIPEKVLRDKEAFMRTEFWERPPVAHIMSWAAGRKTTRVEDRAYSLLGLFGVNMPMLYGEGSKAFQRLQLEIIRVSGDHSIFAWNPKGQFGAHQGVLADDPSYFRGCHDITRVDANFFGEVETYMRHNGPVSVDEDKLGSLERGAYSRQFSVFNVTNVGIQVWLPILPCGGISGYFTVILPCLDRYGKLITINLESRGLGLSSGRCLGLAHIRDVCPEFRSLYLAYAQDTEQKCHKIRLDDKRTSWHGFTRCGTFPWEITGDTVTLSSRGNTFIVLVYANNDVRCRFAVGLGYYLGRPWASIICDEYPTNQELRSSSWAYFAKQAYDILWDTPIEKSYLRSTMKGVHLPRSIWDARIIVSSATDVMIDIEQCPGCCTGPRECTPMADHPWVPWTSESYGSHELELGGYSARLCECIGKEIVLGDYGDYSSDENFKRRGNIFEDMRELGIDPTDSVYRSVVSDVSSSKRVLRRSQTQHDVVSHSWGENLVLHQPKGLSLPNHKTFELLLKAWCTRLAGNFLVTTVIECSEFYKDDREGRRMDMGGNPASRGGNRTADQRTFIPSSSLKNLSLGVKNRRVH
ncbi:heterokaryon incompatibility protein-domain-containing protein [Pisolithus tinctorius]|nr:heterokaryon incompatibility protein-domain-containing protein [Pisolithus tinctorius]